MTDKAITPPTLAARLGVSKAQVIGWIKDGSLRAIDTSKRRRRPRWKLLPEDVQRFLNHRASQPPEPRQPRRKKDVGVIEFF